MQLNNMDCTGRRSNNAERDSDLGEDLSQDDHSDDSVDSHHHGIRSSRLKVTSVERSNGGDMSFGGAGNSLAGGVGLGVRTPDHHSDLQMSHHHQFPPNHPLNALGNFMGIGSLHGIPNLQHNDVLEKLKMQVRDIKVGLMEQDYAAAHAAAFAPNLLPTTINPAFSLPPTSIASFEHRAQAMAAAGGGNGSIPNGSSAAQQHSTTNTTTVATSGLTNGGNGAVGIGSGGMVAGGGAIGVGIGGSANGSFSFTSPTVPSSKDVNPASNSSTSSEASNSSQQNNGWSFEEQYKQVRQLYEINDDPKRKEFLDDLFSFMQKRGTPINRLPIMAKSVLDLYELYNLVIARGGLVDVINKKLWQEIIKGLHLPSSITSAAFTLRTQYMKYLYPYECDKKNLSTPSELQAAIDGNRREGRRSSYGQYEAMHSQMQMPQIGRQALPAGMQQMTPLALVTHAANNHQAQAAAAAAAAHHRLMAPTFGQMPHLVSHELEQRMMEYLKIMQVKSEQGAGGPLGAGATDVASRVAGAVAGVVGGGGGGGGGGGSGVAGSGGINAGGSHPAATGHSHSSQSPELSTRDALNALEMSRVAFWQMYHNNTSPPASMSASPHPGGVSGISGALGDQHEALNLSDSPPNVTNIKRERVRDNSPDVCDRDNFHHQPPPPKRAGSGLNFPTSFYLPPGMAAAAAAAAANFHHHKSSDLLQDSDAEDNDEDGDAHNTTGNSSSHGDGEHVRGHVNGHHRHHHNSHHLLQNPLHLHSSNGNSMSANHDKSDDSAIENSPSTSGASASGSGIGVAGAVVGVNAAGNGAVSGGHISPISTKKIHLSKPQTSLGNGSEVADRMSESGATNATGASLSDMDTLSLLTGMQFRVARNGVGANGEPQLIVNLELNGMKYSGVLIANTTAATETAEPMDVVDGGNSINTNIHISNDNVDMNEAGITQDEDIPDAESTASIEETPTKTSNGSAATSPAHTNGPTTLKDSLMPSESVDELASRNKDHSEKIKMLTF